MRSSVQTPKETTKTQQRAPDVSLTSIQWHWPCQQTFNIPDVMNRPPTESKQLVLLLFKLRQVTRSDLRAIWNRWVQTQKWRHGDMEVYGTGLFTSCLQHPWGRFSLEGKQKQGEHKDASGSCVPALSAGLKNVGKCWKAFAVVGKISPPYHSLSIYTRAYIHTYIIYIQYIVIYTYT